MSAVPQYPNPKHGWISASEGRTSIELSHTRRKSGTINLGPRPEVTNPIEWFELLLPMMTPRLPIGHLLDNHDT